MIRLFQRVMNFFGLGEDEEFEEEEEEFEQEHRPVMAEPEPVVGRRGGTVVNLHTQKQVRVVLTEPGNYEDTQGIADHLKAHRSVVVNLHMVPYDVAEKIVDFLSGCVYAIGGTMQKLGHLVFLCTPDNVDVQGAISEYLESESRGQLR